VRLVLATRNEHKLRELSELMRPFELDALPDDVQLPPETGTTFADNALGKARAAAAATGRPSVADDSGIEAVALRGAPGVWSARYAGENATDEENLDKLLREVPADGDRRVAYVAALAYVEPGGSEEIVHGRCEGRLATEPRGDASATTPRSFRTITRTSAPWPSSRPRRRTPSAIEGAPRALSWRA
jgi:XTP/dITP diphosphohydrolase